MILEVIHFTDIDALIIKFQSRVQADVMSAEIVRLTRMDPWKGTSYLSMVPRKTYESNVINSKIITKMP